MMWQVDNLTIFLLLVLAGLLLYHRFFSTPKPMVHPLLLGKQSEVSAVRKEGESGVYRNWATGHGTPLTVRPANSLKTVNDIVSNGTSATSAVPKCILDVSLSDEALAELIHLLPIGLAELFTLSVTPTSPTPILVLLPPSPNTSLPLLLLQLAGCPSMPLIVLPEPKLLTSALTSPTSENPPHPMPAVVVVHVSLVDDVVEQVFEDTGAKAGVLIVGDMNREKEPLVERAREKGMDLRWWEELWEVAETARHKASLPAPHFNDIHSYFYTSSPNPEDSEIIKITHLNITAGIAGLLSIFPPDQRPSGNSRDVIASAVRLDSPLGMCIALGTIWSGASLRLIGPPEPVWPGDVNAHDWAFELERLAATHQPSATMIFINASHLATLSKALQVNFALHPLMAVAARQKMTNLRGGSVSRSGLLDGTVCAPAREKALGGVAGAKLRAVVVVGDAPPASSLAAAHVLLSLPITRLYASPLSTGPVFVSHFYDIQSPGLAPSALSNGQDSDDGEVSHTGPPASNIEIVLKGPEAYQEEGQLKERLKGEVWIRGPSVCERIRGGETVEGWVNTRVIAEVQTNGTFIVAPNAGPVFKS